MEIVNTHVAKTHLSQLLERVAKGEVFIIARAGKPIARLSGLDNESHDRTGGQWAGLVRMAEDFDDPLPSDIGDPFGSPS